MNIIDTFIDTYEELARIVLYIFIKIGLIKPKKPNLIWIHMMNGEGIIGYKWYDKHQAYNKKHWKY